MLPVAATAAAWNFLQTKAQHFSLSDTVKNLNTILHMSSGISANDMSRMRQLRAQTPLAANSKTDGRDMVTNETTKLSIFQSSCLGNGG